MHNAYTHMKVCVYVCVHTCACHLSDPIPCHGRLIWQKYYMNFKELAKYVEFMHVCTHKCILYVYRYIAFVCCPIALEI